LAVELDQLTAGPFALRILDSHERGLPLESLKKPEYRSFYVD
jgi:hypothetical protein